MIDLRSDTVTLPSKRMLETIYTAPLGDSGRLDSNRHGEDPTINELEHYAANLLGKEDAAFCVSGIMGNLTALLTHCNPGDTVLVDEHQHLFRREKGGFNPRVGQLLADMYKTDETGLPDEKDIDNKLATGRIKLLCLENTNNDRGGLCMPLNKMQRIYSIAKKYNVPLHLDGARLFNAALALKIDAKQLANNADSIMFCVSKGLGAPIGSLVCGSKEFIYELREIRRWLGGDMRQAGVIAAPALYALKNNISSLEEDYIKAQSLCDSLQNLKNIKVPAKIDTNIVMLNVATGKSKKLVANLLEAGIISGAVDEERVRLVFHRDITQQDLKVTVSTLKKIDTIL